MQAIGSIGEIELLAPSTAHISFFNSPYIGHARAAAVDIYPESEQWGAMITAPVSGIVTHVKKMNMGRAKWFPTDDFDYAIGITPHADDQRVVRVMHCRPEVTVGENVDEHCILGRTLRSRYFDHWTGPHYHVDVMNSSEFHRASMSLPIESSLGAVTPQRSKNSHIDDGYYVQVVSATADRIVINSADLDQAKSATYSGLAAFSKHEVCGILDGGISHYKHGGMITPEKLESDAQILFMGEKLGEVDVSGYGFHRFRRTNILDFRLNEKKIRGISACLYPSSRYHSRSRLPLVLIPAFSGQFNLVEEEMAKFEINMKIESS